MTFVRAAFLCAFLTLIVGAATAHSVIAPYFSSIGSGQAPPQVAIRSTPTRPVRTSHHRAAPPAASATPRIIIQVVTATPAPQRVITPVVARKAQPAAASLPPTATPGKPTVTPAPAATPAPLPSPTPGTIELARYWVDSQQARSGQVVAIGYLIDNTTGRVEHVSLGASLKARRVLTWGDAINDTAHDVVAVVPPGISTHLRYFALPRGLRPGSYDVAWGLREARSGRRVGLAFAPAVLTVTR